MVILSFHVILKHSETPDPNLLFQYTFLGYSLSLCTISMIYLAFVKHCKFETQPHSTFTYYKFVKDLISARQHEKKDLKIRAYVLKDKW